ncbi:MAG: AgmX/PglI C-terminal domain-containing protein [Xanthomonadaceae bacterium]|nr:AgmX/PglI C-terminal domain-containing protein [Xanthomonadaceae bacterium]
MSNEKTLSTSLKWVAVFRVTTPEGQKTFRIHKERIILGSLGSADIRVASEKVSPIHAIIEWSESGAVLFDLASDSGTRVNGEPAITRNLVNGDKILIENVEIVYSREELQSLIPKFQPKAAGERKLFRESEEVLTPLILENEAEIEDIFEYPPRGERALEVVMSWMGVILNIEHFIKEKEVVLGSAPFVAPHNVKLVTRSGNDYFLQLDPLMTGVLQRRGELTKLDVVSQSGSQVPFKSGDFAKIKVGEIAYYISFCEAPPHIKRKQWVERDPFFYRTLVTSLLVSGALIVTMMKVQISPDITAEEVPERIATILYQPEKFKAPPRIIEPSERKVPKEPEAKLPKPKPKRIEIDLKPKNVDEKKPMPKEINVGQKTEQAKPKAQPKQKNKAKEGEGAKAKGKEGQRGKPNAAKGETAQTKAFRPSPMAGTGTGGGNSQAKPEEGNVDLLSGSGARIDNILGNAAEKIGKSGSRLTGFGGFDTQGNGGLGAAGIGKGGGGTASSLGGLGNKGIGGGRVGTGAGAAGNGTGLVGGKSRVNIRSGGPEETVVMGAMDYDAINAAILAHRDEFRLCYERELNAENPDLGGRVSTNFVIGSTGRVSTAAVLSSSLKNANAERCILEVIKRIDFPKPNGGGEVSVNYPFRYSAGGK